MHELRDNTWWIFLVCFWVFSPKTVMFPWFDSRAGDGESRAGDGESRALLATSCWPAGPEKKKVDFVRQTAYFFCESKCACPLA